MILFRNINERSQHLDMFDQVQDMKFMLDQNTLLFSAVKNGQSDIFVYKIDQGSLNRSPMMCTTIWMPPL